MNIVFVSNYLNHHQLPLCKAFEELSGRNFYFVATAPVPEQRLELGYDNMNAKYSFVIATYDSDTNVELAIKKVNNADVVIIGSAPRIFVKERLKQGKIVFWYSERLFKNKVYTARFIYHFIRDFLFFNRYKNQYLLCSSAFTSNDYAKIGTFHGRAYKWGYFPCQNTYDVVNLLKEKKTNSILWVARFVDLKHPEVCIHLAQKMVKDGINDCHITMIGCGPMLNGIKEQVVKLHLEKNVSILGSVKADKVRNYMEQSEIFIFSSDRHEGWGAVMNEAMNSGCAVIASSAIGSVPFLLHNNENGLIYKDGDEEDLYDKVRTLYNNPIRIKQLGEAAYNTITSLWNADIAAERLIKLKADLEKEGNSDRFVDGPCSKALKVKDRWYDGNI